MSKSQLESKAAILRTRIQEVENVLNQK
uniref:Uncharacterized protein n=1 Tax=Arundo donax TaxID=35708 RepID=A0A0A9BZ25_ARUDO